MRGEVPSLKAMKTLLLREAVFALLLKPCCTGLSKIGKSGVRIK